MLNSDSKKGRQQPAVFLTSVVSIVAASQEFKVLFVIDLSFQDIFYDCGYRYVAVCIDTPIRFARNNLYLFGILTTIIQTQYIIIKNKHEKNNK